GACRRPRRGRSVRQRVERQYFRHARLVGIWVIGIRDAEVSVGSRSRAAHSAVERCARQYSLVYARGRNELASGLALQLTKAFEIAKEEQLVFFDLPSQRASELIPVKRGNVRRRIIEVILRVENAVAQKIKRRAMQCVRARSAYRVDHGAGSSEFSAVGVGQ